MAIEDWEPARLIPVSGIKGADEQERRGVSALLAVLESVREFGRAILAPLGAPGGSVSTFIEVNFDLGGRTVRPDGLIQVKRGQRTWTALVEVKTGRNDLQTQQLETYLEVARANAFDLVLTISNQLVAIPGEHPTAVDRKKLRKVGLSHLSWSQIHTEAVIERVNRAVADPDQAWILAELIRYLEHPQSGAVDFDDMGASWVGVRNAATDKQLHKSDPGVTEVVSRFSQLVSFAGMRLSRRLGVSVEPIMPRAEARDASLHIQNGIARLIETGALSGTLRVPNTVAPIDVIAAVDSGRVTCMISVNAPTQGRNRTRVNWLVRQLSEAPAEVVLEAWPLFARSPGPPQKLSDVRDNPDLLFEDPKKEIKSFTVRLTATSGTKRGQGTGSFVRSVLSHIDKFYESVVQPIKPWTQPAPSAKPRDSSIDDAPDEDGITGELPLNSRPRSSAASQTVETSDEAEPLHYITDGPQPDERQPSEEADALTGD